jgi:hypothetical protein
MIRCKYYQINEYRISANSYRGNYSFLNLTLCTVTFDVTVHTGAETIQGRKLFAEIRYEQKLHYGNYGFVPFP